MLTVIAVILAAGVGYVMTWVKFVSSDFEAPYKSEVIYGIGVVIPFVGAVTGYIDVEN